MEPQTHRRTRASACFFRRALPAAGLVTVLAGLGAGDSVRLAGLPWVQSEKRGAWLEPGSAQTENGAADPAAATPNRGSSDLIGAIQRLEKKVGFHRTHNFRHRSDKISAFYRCYYTGKLELPDSYEGLQLQEGNKDGCTVDAQKYDVFFYPIEAVGSGKSPITASLEKDSVERTLFVVPHEDFHRSKELRQAPASVSEAAATLIGFLAASEVARQKFGVDSDAYRKLTADPEIFLRKAEIVNRTHAQVSGLYAQVRDGKVDGPSALAAKAKLFQQAQTECKAIGPDPSSFNKCLAANNNAGLAFDVTYTRHYPLMYQVYAAHHDDLPATITAVKQLVAGWPQSGSGQER